MLSASFLNLQTALYEWGKHCPRDAEKELKEFFGSKAFLDRPDVFYKGFDDSSKKWFALMSMTGIEQTQGIMNKKWNYSFLDLYASKVAFSQVQPAPKIPNAAAYNKFLKDIEKLNKLNKARERLNRWRNEFDRAVGLYCQSPVIRQVVTLEEGGGSSSTATSGTETAAEPVTAPWSTKSPVPAMLFISVDIESYEMDHSKILEIGWSMWDSGLNLFKDKHYAVMEYQYLKNGKYCADRRDLFMFGETVWAPLKQCIGAFQQELDQAAAYNREQQGGDGSLVLIAHDMGSDEGYLKKMGVQFPEAMIKFDTQEMNAARIGNSNRAQGLGKLLDDLDIENYSLHNAGNDAHYTLELFLWLIRDRIAKYDGQDASILGSALVTTSTSISTPVPVAASAMTSQAPLIDLPTEIQNLSLV